MSSLIGLKKASFFLAGFNLDKSYTTIRVMIGIGPKGGPMEQSPRTHSEVVWVHIVMDGAVDGGLVPSINDAMVKSAEVRQFNIVMTYESYLHTSQIMGDRLVKMGCQVYTGSCEGRIYCT